MNATPPPDLETQIDEVLAGYLEAVEAGTAPPRSQLLAAHPALADELAAFFDAERQFDSLMAPLSVTPPSQVTQLPLLEAGELVGNYRIVREIARGGMGVVYEAEQTIGAQQRRVALKMLRHGALATDDDVRRFQLESAAVAHLDHPAIVPMLEVGDHHGLPYYCMPLIAGGTLADHIARFANDFHACAQLVADIADGVHHAHQRGILHRDLKPANVLLVASGGWRVAGENQDNPDERTAPWDSSSRATRHPPPATPKIADFGLARRLEDSRRTLSGVILGTPSYMAPEQAMGASVTVAADIYSLGAILYELLTGQPPFQMGTALGTLVDVLERDPAPPRLLNPQVPRDLEIICLKCLDKEPARRYDSALSLRQDLQRFLAGEPIAFRALNPGERLVRWARRNPVVAALSACVVALLLGGAALSGVLWLRAERNLDEAVRQKEEVEIQRQRALDSAREKEAARQQAEVSYRQARDVLDNLHNRLTDRRLNELPGAHAIRREILADGLKYYRAFAAQHGDDPTLRAEMARTYFRIAMLINVVGSKQEAIDAYNESLRQFARLEQEEPERAEWVSGQANVLNNLGNLENGLGQRAAAIDHYDAARARWQRLHDRDQDNPQYTSGLASALANLAGMYRHTGDTQRAVEFQDRARAMQETLVQLDPNAPDYQASLAHSYFNLGVDALGGKDRAAGLEWLEKAYKLQDRLATRHRERLWDARDLAVTCRHLGTALLSTAQAERGQKMLERARQLLEGLGKANPDVTDFQADLANHYAHLGVQLAAKQQLDEAHEMYLRARDIQFRLLDANPEMHEWRHGLAQTQHNLGNLYLQANRPCEASACFHEAARAYLLLLEREPDNSAFHHEIGGSLNNRGDAVQRLEQWDEAVTLFERAIEYQKRAYEAKPNALHRSFLSSHYHNLARAHRLAKRHAVAVELTLTRRTLWQDNPGEMLRTVRDFLLAAQLTPEGEPYIKHALETVAMALKAGYRDLKHLRTHPDFGPLRARPEFEKLLQSYEAS